MKMWILNDYNHLKYSFFKDLINDYSKEKGVNIELDIKSRETLWNDIFAFFEHPDEKLADIIEIPHQWTSLVTKLGLSLPIDLIFEDCETLKIFDFLKKGMVFESTQRFFSIPIYFEIPALYYRKDMLSKVIRCEISQIKWDDFFDLCDKLLKKFNKKDYYPLDNTNINGYITSDDILVSVMNKTQGYFSSDNTSLNIHKEEVISTIVEYLSLARKKYIPLFEENFYDIGFTKRGLSSMAFSFRSDLIDMDNIGVTRFPDIMRKNELARSFNFFFFSATQNIDILKDFFKWFYTPSNLYKLSKGIGTFSPFYDELDKLFPKKDFDFFKSLTSNAVMISNNVVYPSFEKMMDEALKRACIKIVNNEFDEMEFKNNLLEIKGLSEYLIVSY